MSTKSGPAHKLILGLFAAAALSGCMSTDAMFDDQQHAVSHASDNYPITASQSPRVLEVSAAAGTLGAVDAASVRGYLAALRHDSRSPLVIAPAAGQGNSARVAAEIASLAISEGIPRQMIAVSSYAGPADGPVRLSYVSSRPSVRACGNWPEDLALSTAQNTSYENLGCAVQTNIAAMVDNPDTLNKPVPTDLSTSPSQTNAIDRMNTRVNDVTLPTNYDYIQ